MGKRGPYKKRLVEERFWSKVDKSGGPDACWPWLAAIDQGGYGTFWAGVGRSTRPHIFAYESEIGVVPNGLDLDHVCHTRDLSCEGGPTCLHRKCVNPAHLEPVTRRVNLKRGRLKGPIDGGGAAKYQRDKTHCPKGHEYTAENTYTPPSRPSARYCRRCHLLATWKRRGRDIEGMV